MQLRHELLQLFAVLERRVSRVTHLVKAKCSRSTLCDVVRRGNCGICERDSGKSEGDEGFTCERCGVCLCALYVVIHVGGRRSFRDGFTNTGRHS